MELQKKINIAIATLDKLSKIAPTTVPLYENCVLINEINQRFLEISARCDDEKQTLIMCKSSGLISQLDSLMRFADKYNKNAEIARLVRDYFYIKLDIQEQISKTCDFCSEIYIVDDTSGQYMCIKCGDTIGRYGTAQDENLDGTQPKTGYKKNPHIRLCLMAVQGRENFSFPDGFIKQVKQTLKESGIYRKSAINVEKMRTIFKKIEGGSAMNHHIPKAICEITGEKPEFISDYEFNIVEEKTSAACSIISSTSPGNCPYLPFIIMKIIEQVLKEDTIEQKKRKAKIITNFHLQHETTLRNREAQWKDVCSKHPEYKYQPTDMNKYMKWMEY
jgi:hypothetical protein